MWLNKCSEFSLASLVSCPDINNTLLGNGKSISHPTLFIRHRNGPCSPLPFMSHSVELDRRLLFCCTFAPRKLIDAKRPSRSSIRCPSRHSSHKPTTTSRDPRGFFECCLIQNDGRLNALNTPQSRSEPAVWLWSFIVSDVLAAAGWREAAKEAAAITSNRMTQTSILLTRS